MYRTTTFAEAQGLIINAIESKAPRMVDDLSWNTLRMLKWFAELFFWITVGLMIIAGPGGEIVLMIILPLMAFAGMILMALLHNASVSKMKTELLLQMGLQRLK
jgi:hypothetical protein